MLTMAFTSRPMAMRFSGRLNPKPMSRTRVGYASRAL